MHSPNRYLSTQTHVCIYKYISMYVYMYIYPSTSTYIDIDRDIDTDRQIDADIDPDRDIDMDVYIYKQAQVQACAGPSTLRRPSGRRPVATSRSDRAFSGSSMGTSFQVELQVRELWLKLYIILQIQVGAGILRSRASSCAYGHANVCTSARGYMCACAELAWVICVACVVGFHVCSHLINSFIVHSVVCTMLIYVYVLTIMSCSCCRSTLFEFHWPGSVVQLLLALKPGRLTGSTVFGQGALCLPVGVHAINTKRCRTSNCVFLTWL